MAYFSRALKPAQVRYSTFDRELLGIYLAIKHFRYFVEGRHFHVLTDHKPLTFALANKPDRYSPRQSRQLDFISQFTSDIRHVKGTSNAAADALSRLPIHAVHTGDSTTVVDFRAMAAAQLEDRDLPCIQTDSSLQLQQVPLALSEGSTILCDVSTGGQRPFVPASFRRLIFDVLHSLSHPGIRATQRLITRQFVWPGINADVRRWARSCLQCQRAKVHRHTTSLPGTFATPDARFDPGPHRLGWTPPTLEWLHIPVDMCRSIHSVAGGSTPHGYHCGNRSEGIHHHLGSPFWHTFCCHH